jgi:hypothetical protein
MMQVVSTCSHDQVQEVIINDFYIQGQAGTGETTLPDSLLKEVVLPTRFICISAGYEDHTMAIAAGAFQFNNPPVCQSINQSTDHTLWGWGSNKYGQNLIL